MRNQPPSFKQFIVNYAKNAFVFNLCNDCSLKTFCRTKISWNCIGYSLPHSKKHNSTPTKLWTVFQHRESPEPTLPRRPLTLSWRTTTSAASWRPSCGAETFTTRSRNFSNFSWRWTSSPSLSPSSGHAQYKIRLLRYATSCSLVCLFLKTFPLARLFAWIRIS